MPDLRHANHTEKAIAIAAITNTETMNGHQDFSPLATESTKWWTTSKSHCIRKRVPDSSPGSVE